MLRLVRQRLAMLVLVLFGVSFITFLMSHVLPGDPAAALAGPHPSKELLQAIRDQFGLDKPLQVQYLNYLNDLIHGNLGTSIRSQEPVLTELMRYFPLLSINHFCIYICNSLGNSARCYFCS